MSDSPIRFHSRHTAARFDSSETFSPSNMPMDKDPTPGTSRQMTVKTMSAGRKRHSVPVDTPVTQPPKKASRSMDDTSQDQQLSKITMDEFISVSSIKNVLTECPICTEQFDDNSRIPRRMPCCVQSICQRCLETYSKGHQTLSCPLCRHQHHLPVGVKSLPKEPLILKILDHLKIQKGIRLPCTGCPDNDTAVSQCHNCGIFLCTQCQNAHVRNMVTKNHKIVTFTEMKGCPVESFRRLHQCAAHQLPHQFYCMTCDVVICTSCTVVDHKEGKGHHVISLDEAHQDKGKTADDVLIKLDDKVKRLGQTMEDLQRKKKNIETSRQRAKGAINREFDNLLELLQQRRSLLLFEVDDKSDKILKVTDEVLESTRTSLTKVKSSTEYTKQMRSKADTIEDLQLIASSIDSLKSMLEESTQDVEFDRTGINFVPAKVQHLISTIEISGLVRRVTFSASEKPEFVPEDQFYSTITLEPADFLQGPDIDMKIMGKDDVIVCPLLELDSATASSHVTISESTISNTKPDSPLQDTGCRIQGVRYVLSSRPLVFKKRQRMMFHVHFRFSLKQVIPNNKLIFETALVKSPVDSNYNQPGLSVGVVTCPNDDQQLYLRVSYDRKTLSIIRILNNEVGESYEGHLSFLLDGDTNKIHVCDVDGMKVVQSVTDVVFDEPLWVMMFVDDPSLSDMSCKLISGSKVNVSQDLTNLLSSLH